MRTKSCPICGTSYENFIEYCFRDGHKLYGEGEEPELDEQFALEATEAIPLERNTRAKPSAPLHSDDKTEPFGLVYGKKEDSRELELDLLEDPTEEQLEEPKALGNTLLFTRTDLESMFTDDSTFNGEMNVEDLEEDLDTVSSEDMDATETFEADISTQEETVPAFVASDLIKADSQIEFDQEDPITIDSSVAPPAKPSAPPKDEPIKKPSPTTSNHETGEKQANLITPLLMGALAAVVCIIIGVLYLNQTQSSQLNIPPPDNAATSKPPKDTETKPIQEAIVEPVKKDQIDNPSLPPLVPSEDDDEDDLDYVPDESSELEQPIEEPEEEPEPQVRKIKTYTLIGPSGLPLKSENPDLAVPNPLQIQVLINILNLQDIVNEEGDYMLIVSSGEGKETLNFSYPFAEAKPESPKEEQ